MKYESAMINRNLVVSPVFGNETASSCSERTKKELTSTGITCQPYTVDTRRSADGTWPKRCVYNSIYNNQDDKNSSNKFVYVYNLCINYINLCLCIKYINLCTYIFPLCAEIYFILKVYINLIFTVDSESVFYIRVDIFLYIFLL